MEVPHEVIRASAGSGKTYQLTNRFVRLLALGEPPRSIIALTFTRKAAGEFLDRTLGKLADAAEDPAAARHLAEEIGQPKLERGDFARLLREVVSDLHRLSMSTLDSFFVRILGAFALELGLSGDLQILEGGLKRREKIAALTAVFDEFGGDLAKSAAPFLEDLKRASFGEEPRGVVQTLENLVEKYHQLFLAAPKLDLWGNPHKIWPNGAPWLDDDPPKSLADDAASLAERLADASLKPKQLQRWQTFANAMAGFDAARADAFKVEPLKYILTRTLDSWDDICSGSAHLKIERGHEISGEACRLLRRILGALIRIEFSRQLEHTAGLGGVLDAYERRHHAVVRQEGKLTFQDVALLLARRFKATDPASPAGSLAFRLDGWHDHWLLDEFQDTSGLQWDVICGFVDEVIQDADDRRTYFQVGDTKQAIYGWRGGDVRLFDEVLRLYNRPKSEPRVKERPLSESYRSAPPVIDMVNRVFGNLDAAEGSIIPAAALAHWKWEEHHCAPRLRDKPGCAVIWHVTAPEGDSASAELADVSRAAVALLKEIEPHRRGLSCAVLVRRNETARALADCIRRGCDAPVLVDAEFEVGSDSGAAAALLDLLHLAAHPGDSFCWEHVRMTPLGSWLAAEEMTPRKLSSEVRRDIFRLGFEETIRRWTAKFDLAARLDSFSRSRADDLALIGRQADAEGPPDIDAFVAAARAAKVREVDLPGVIQVMTIHKAKGLGFDMVILPEMEGARITETLRSAPVIHEGADRRPEWVLSLPKKAWRALDPVIEAHCDSAEANAAYEKLCVLYVAMTRAKQGLYILQRKPARNDGGADFRKLLLTVIPPGANPAAVTLPDDVAVEEVFAAEGSRHDWWQERAEAEPPARREEREVKTPSPRESSRLVRRTPSAHTQKLTARQLFGLEGHDARRFGTDLHAIFEAIEWVGDPQRDLPAAVRKWKRNRPQIDPGDEELLAAEARKCLDNPEVRALFEPPGDSSSGAEFRLWRERSFEAVVDGAWISGTFDRVVLTVQDGRPVAARIIDFKSDRVDSADAARERAAIYAGQIDDYRKVLAMLAGIPESSVSSTLVFTAVPAAVAMEKENAA